ncbi:MAG: pyridoxamine 5'-phosphate oxidase family protein [Ramlibacter sp.]|nr:pyridoxamine 5'-phosphate oxidase family protein [Ramlibacter sp.]
MSRAYSDITFTPTVRAMQTRMGTRAAYAALDRTDDRRDALTADEVDFIQERDTFYQATVSESGWPYVQHRGGPAGFLKVLDAKTIAYADFRGNVQYISVGNLQGNDPALMAFLQTPGESARPPRIECRVVARRRHARLQLHDGGFAVFDKPPFGSRCQSAGRHDHVRLQVCRHPWDRTHSLVGSARGIQ